MAQDTANSLDPQIMAEARIATLTSLLSSLMDQMIYWQTTARAMSIRREREQPPPEQGEAVA